MSDVINILAKADETYAKLPLEIRLWIEEVAKTLPEFGPRFMRFSGPGTEVYDYRRRREGEDVRKVNAKLSAKRGYDVVVEHQAENRQPVFFWRKGVGSMNVVYDSDRLSKKSMADITTIAIAKVVAGSDDMIGVLEQGGMYRGSAGVSEVGANLLLPVNIIAGDRPVMGRKLPRESTVVLMSDFFGDADRRKEIAFDMSQLQAAGVKGIVCMIVDPQELEFGYEGHVLFNGPDDELGAEEKEDAQSIRDEYIAAMNDHIRWVQKLAQSYGFRFILQRADEEPLNLAIRVFGLEPNLNRDVQHKPAEPQL